MGCFRWIAPFTWGKHCAGWMLYIASTRCCGRSSTADDLLASRPVARNCCGGAPEHLPPPRPHEHEPSGDPVAMFLTPRSGEAGPSLPLSPFLSVQPCEWCGQPTAFFFDKYERAKNKKSKTFCLEYFGGHL